MINYIETIGLMYDGVRVSSTDPYDYDAIDWGNETVITQADLDAAWLTCYKIQYITAMSELARADIESGFPSDALGEEVGTRIYDSAQEDQLNLIGAAGAGDSMEYGVRVNGVKSYVFHTHAQLLQVVQDGRDVKLGTLQTFNTKKNSILAATTKAEVDAITW